jgi:hypothetical protein
LTVKLSLLNGEEGVWGLLLILGTSIVIDCWVFW